MPAWQPLDETGAPAGVGTRGRWLSAADDVHATDAEGRIALWSAERVPAAFPRNWPAVYKESKALKGLLNKAMLKGLRCRAVSPPTEGDLASVAGVPLHPLHSFSNASRLAALHGWSIVKGFLVLERAEAAPGESFVALRHWWNAKEEGGPWLDFTPPYAAAEDARVLLVESTLGEKPEAPLTQGALSFATSLAKRLVAGAVASPPPPPPPSTLPAASAPLDAKAAQLPMPPKPATPAVAAAAQKKKIDYSKWDNVDVSDDDEPPPPKVDPKEAAAIQKAQREAAEKQAAQEQRNQVNLAINAAAAAAAAGDADALAGMQAAYREAAPLDAQMESIIGALPEAAQIAARASATLAAAGGQPVAESAAPAKEPSLKELLAAQKLELVDDDPELEDPREFFETASAAAKAEGVLAQEQRASAERVAAHLARAPPQQPAAPKTVPEEDVEWVGEWS